MKRFATAAHAAAGGALPTLDFVLPAELEASEPPEARGLARDEVRLIVSCAATGSIEHTRFRSIGRYLEPGDLLVVNTSGTMNAALPARRTDGTVLELHLSTRLPSGLWTAEFRLPRDDAGTVPFKEARAGERIELPQGAFADVVRPYPTTTEAAAGSRLWEVSLQSPSSVSSYVAENGFPIRYGYVRQSWPREYYQTVFATEAGSAEMPSAGRPFTAELVTCLVAHGVQIAPLLLHTGVASLEEHEPPYAEYYKVPAETARIVNQTRAAGRRVIAVGTTVVRALETTTDDAGRTHGGEGWTEVVITPKRGVRAVTGLLTGLHEPRATHLAMLAAVADLAHLRVVYAEALRERYLWHEFGDSHLLLA
jgi:S-adenosylmethionine:tRNA ribosyltransferase-isomerase